MRFRLRGGGSQDSRRPRPAPIIVACLVAALAGLLAGGALSSGASAASPTCTGVLSVLCPPTTTTTPTSTTPVTIGPQGRRITVALFGDSVTQSIAIPNFQQDGLGGQLDDQLGDLGFQTGGEGFVPAVPYFFDFNAVQKVDQGPVPQGGWATEGYGKVTGHDGPNGYSASTGYQSATATLQVTDPELEVLYTTSPDGCPFTVTDGKLSWSLNSQAAGPPEPAESPITLPAGKQTIVVHGPSCGQLTFDGIVDHAPVAAGQTQVEVDNLGHAAHEPWLDWHPRVRQALIQQQYNVSVFLWAFIAEIQLSRYSGTHYLRVMEQRAQVARMHGGACLIVAPPPIAATRAGITKVRGFDEVASVLEGCTYTTVLTHLWPSVAAAEKQGLLIGDGVHPTAAGYTAIDHALAPVVAQLIHQQEAGDSTPPTQVPAPAPGTTTPATAPTATSTSPAAG